MEQDKVKLMKHTNGYKLYINGTEMNKVKDFKIDKFGVNSVVTVQLTCVDLEIISEDDEKEKQDCTVRINTKIDSKLIYENLSEYVRKNLVNKVGD